MIQNVKLPDGTVVALCDWLCCNLYASFAAIPAAMMRGPVEPFSASRSQPMPGDPTRDVTRVDSNIQRSGDHGLPQGYEALIYSWRATTALPMSEELERYAAGIFCELSYNEKIYDQMSLLDLLRTPAGWSPDAIDSPLSPDNMHKLISELPKQPDATLIRLANESARDGGYKLPIHMRENFSYRVHVTIEHKHEIAPFTRWLQNGQNPIAQRIREIATTSTADHGTMVALVALADEISPPRYPLFKIHLEGLFKRPLF